MKYLASVETVLLALSAGSAHADEGIERRLHVATANASSFLWNDWNRFQENYHPNYVADGDPKTAWVEGADGNGEGEWLKLPLTELANTTAVIVGGATPIDTENDDPSTSEDNEFGEGSLFVDFDADRAFDEEFDPNFDPAASDRGKFVAIFGKGPDEDDPEQINSVVIAAFRDFVQDEIILYRKSQRQTIGV